MTDDALFENHIQVLKALLFCVEQRLHLPALMLIYSVIDIYGWLSADNGNASVRENFTEFVDRYMLPAKPLRCNSWDLYAARCALLHTLTPDSDLSDKGRAKRIAYAWGDVSDEELQRSIDLLGFPNLVALHVHDLLEAFRLGATSFFQDLKEDGDREQRFREKANSTFRSMGMGTIREYLVGLAGAQSGA